MATNNGAESIPTLPTNLMSTLGVSFLTRGDVVAPTLPTNLMSTLGVMSWARGITLIPSAGVVTTYFYRLSGPPYTRGSTTTQGGWPPGSVIEYILVT